MFALSFVLFLMAAMVGILWTVGKVLRPLTSADFGKGAAFGTGSLEQGDGMGMFSLEGRWSCWDVNTKGTVRDHHPI